MSSGQRPRRYPFFPKMKDRGRKRGVTRTTLYGGSDFKPLWPQEIDGFSLDRNRLTGRHERQESK